MDKFLGSGSLLSVGELLKPYQPGNTGILNFPPGRVLTAPPAVDTQAPRRVTWQQAAVPMSIAPVLATVSGMVLDERGNPVAGAVVSLTASSIAYTQPQARMTLADGSYRFMDTPGEYFISARLGGDRDSGSHKVTLTPGSPSNLNLSVQRASEGVSPEPPAIREI